MFILKYSLDAFFLEKKKCNTNAQTCVIPQTKIEFSSYGNLNTLRQRQNRRWHIQVHFLERKYLNSDQDFTEVCSHDPMPTHWIKISSLKKMYLKMPSAKYRPFCPGLNVLTHWGRDKMDAISQTPFSSSFSWMKMLEFRLKFHWTSFLRVQLTISHHWFR